ncbi:ParA family partition ATPase [Oceanicella actignis]|uniref:Chromosome partitioning protein n=1 Tax=Oceanicella actignis TaxID=1189325 RepID=A0A1M7T9K4_9RHOB|nr:ParA family partition ATPase [Oceanicella actignis]TYO89137.1 chromosome partitioning protein [Oceanicella actignis]SET51043.1 chromosome partitioning protein [Oceanicella actignis]SHN67369.1 chromosome partitioning protein [Oceanicella actignis]
MSGAARVVTLAQQKGGSGKTTIAAQLAALWTRRGLRVALIDLDPQRSLTRWAELRGDPALTAIESKDWRAGVDIDRARRAADRVLADCPGAAEPLLRAAARAADLVLTPVQPSAPDIWALERTVRMCADEGARVRAVLNRVPPRGGAVEEAAAALAEMGAPPLAARLGNRVAFAAAFARGRAAFETAPRAKAAEELAALEAEIEALLNARP